MINFCIPSRDEDRTIGVLLWKIREVMLDLKRDYRAFVFDDGSRDGTRNLLEKYKRVLPLTVMGTKRPVGYGSAVEQLLRMASGKTSYPRRDAIVTMQGDFTEHPAHLPTLIRTFEGGADIVAGRPEEAGRSGEGAAGLGRGGGSHPPLGVRVSRRLGRFLLREAPVGSFGGDPLCGFRVYRVVVVKNALRTVRSGPLLTRDGWAANAELLNILAPFARRVAEVPVQMRYDIRQRPTRVRVFPTVREVLRVRKVPPLEPGGRRAA